MHYLVTVCNMIYKETTYFEHFIKVVEYIFAESYSNVPELLITGFYHVLYGWNLTFFAPRV